MITLRPAQARGHAEHGWLESWHTFSFADYYDPEQMGFRGLRVINDDRVAPSRGFPAHPHRDMEILTYVLEGALEHRDSMGTGSIIRPGELQRMSAGTGVEHSEFNASDSQVVHLLQIWLLPQRRGLEPSYEQKAFPEEQRRGRLRLVASPDGAEGSVVLHTDARLFVGLLSPGDKAVHPLAPGRHAWVQVATGAVRLGGRDLKAGDGAAVSDESSLELEGVERGEVLLFDLA